MNVAHIIKMQIGVPTLMEVGARGFVAFEDRLHFTLRKANGRLRKVAVVLDPSDTYTVLDCDSKGFDNKSLDGVYNDMLPEIIRGLAK